MIPDTRQDPAADRLDSWKDIAAYLRRDVSTVQRWEKKQGLPVHRHIHDKQGSVYAFKSELDTWWRQGANQRDLSDEDASTRHLKTRRTLLRLTAAAAVIVAATAIWWSLPNRTFDRSEVVRSAIPLPADVSNAFPLISPDGKSFVYQGVPRNGPLGPLYIKDIDELEGRPLPGTEGALQPFFSPGGQWIGYFVDGKLFKVATKGGAPPTYVADATTSHRGGTWLVDDTIVFSNDNFSGLSKVSAGGGTVSTFTTPDRSLLERTHRWPSAVPGHNAVLFTVQRASDATYDDANIEAFDLATGERKLILRGGSNPISTESGHLLFARHGQIWSAPFDRKRLRVTGDASVVIDHVMYVGSTGRVAMTLSTSGTLVYGPGGNSVARELLWSDRNGRFTPAIPRRGSFQEPRISPDGKYVAVTVDDGVPRVFVLDVERNNLERFTEGWDAGPAFWSPEGTKVAFTRDGFAADRHTLDLVAMSRVPADEAPFIVPSGTSLGNDWSSDGQIALYGSAGGISMLRVNGPREIKTLIPERYFDRAPRFSPDGQWLAYMSDRSGELEVYVIEVGGKHRRWQISNHGGQYPVWARNGAELFYRQQTPRRIMSVSVETKNDIPFTPPRELFEAPPGANIASAFDVGPDGRFILVAGTQETLRTNGLIMVQNFFKELREKVPVQ